ncbi:hypothetical protein M8J77_021883 [Diaphorina citri]|nr:hypothetical protein M8J77_021883 [Diaphorina citri]
MDPKKKQSTHAAFTTTLLEIVGFVNFYRKDKQWKNHLQQVYCYVNHLLLLWFLLFHLLRTATESYLFLPVFMQVLGEDVVFISMYIQIFLMNRKHKQLAELVHLIENSFSNVDQKIVQKYENKVRRCFRTYSIIMGLGFCELVTESLKPLPPNEIEHWHQVYKAKHPERRLPYNMKIPFIDETESRNYQVIFTLQVYVFGLTFILISIIFTMMPTMTLNLIAQYRILCQYIEKLGAPHYDLNGKEIIYTNIETNEYLYINVDKPQVMYNQWLDKSKDHGEENAKTSLQESRIQKEEKDETVIHLSYHLGKMKQSNQNETYEKWAIKTASQITESGKTLKKSKKQENIDETTTQTRHHRFQRQDNETALNNDGESMGSSQPKRTQSSHLNHHEREIYQKEYLKQVIKFHQKLLIFQQKTSANFIAIALCLQQIIFTLKTLPFIFALKFFGGFIAYVVQSFFWCHCSELLDDCNIMICRAIRNSQWVKCDCDTRKDVCMLLRRAQRSNYLRFSQGTITLCRKHFLAIMKIAYSFVNFMKVKNELLDEV